MNAPARSELAELLDHLRSIVETQLLEYHMDAKSAGELAAAVVARVRDDWGGQNVYIPKVMSRAEIAERNKAIVSTFNGINALELCRKYGISATHLRRILAAAALRAAPEAPA
jgi:Mor family transcriptional regulator